MLRIRNTMLLAISAAAVWACQTATPAAELDDETRAAITEEVRGVVADFFDAMNAHDAERILAHYAESDDFLYVGIVNPEIGRDRLEFMVGRWVTRDSMMVTYDIRHVQVLSPTVATAFSQGAYSTSETGTAWTHVLVRGDDGQWRIVLEHEAWPTTEVRVRGPHPMTQGGEAETP